MARSSWTTVAQVSVATTVAALVAAPSAAAAAPSTWGYRTERLTVSSTGHQAGVMVLLDADQSADGRYVVFTCNAPNLVAGETHRGFNVYLRDRQNGTTTRLTTAMPGSGAEGGGAQGHITPDGRYVSFASDSPDLVPDDTNDKSDVFIRDLVTGTTERVSVSSSGAQATGGPESSGSYLNAVSADGRYVAFVSTTSNLVRGDTNEAGDVFVHDRSTGTTRRVNVGPASTQSSGGVLGLAISDDGHVVAFTSAAADLVAGDTNGRVDAFVHDLTTGSTERVSVSSSGTQSEGEVIGEPSVSGDGRYVAFDNDGIVGHSDTNERFDVFLRDRVAGTTTRVSVDSQRHQLPGGSAFPHLSADGRYLSFHYTGLPLGVGMPGGAYVRDLVARTTRLASLSQQRQSVLDRHPGPLVSDDGLHLVFASDESSVVPGDTNRSVDLFVRDRRPPTD